MTGAAAPSPRAWPAAVHLMLFAAIIALPLLVLLGTMLHRSALREHQRLERAVGQELDEVVAAVDRDIERRIAVLQTLATAPSLATEDWPALHAQATESLGHRNHLVLVDLQGRQLVNTYTPYAAATAPANPPDVEAVRRKVAPVVSDLFTSLVSKRLAFNVSIPIMRDGQLRYIMSLALFPEDLLAVLADQRLESGWTMSIWDGNGLIVAHSRDHDRWVGSRVPEGWLARRHGDMVEDNGLDGAKVIARSARLRLADWTVRISFPARQIDDRIEDSLWLWAAAAVLIVLLTAGAAYVFGLAITRPLAASAAAANALGRGEPVELLDTRIAEVNALNRALREARREIDDSRSALRQSEQLFGTAADAAQFGAHQYDAINDRVYRSPQIRRILGTQPGEDRDFETAQAIVHPEDRDQVRARKQQILKSEEQYQLTYRIRRPDGEVRWVMDRGQVERDMSGRALRVIGVLVDITDLKAVEQRQRLLFDELNHRVKNTLTIVQSLAQHTHRTKPDPRDFIRAFGERLRALSQAHDLLARTARQGASLRDLVEGVLQPFAIPGGRVAIEGDPVDVPPNVTTTLALMLNELATNAVKYGALSVDDGKVTISWSVGPIDQSLAIDLLWREEGGPAVVEPERRGFGSRLLATSAQQIKGTFEVEFAPSGLVVRLHFKIPKPMPEMHWPGVV